MLARGERRLSRRSAEREGGPSMKYVYILQSEQADRFYVGLTGDPEVRLAAHNAGDSTHTSKYRPWTLRTVVAFADEAKAVAFERYLKTASGRAFAKKRF